MTAKDGALIPVWIKERCLQCGLCAYVCPTGALRALTAAPSVSGDDDSLPLKGCPEQRYKLALSVRECTGCGLCVSECPAKGKALVAGERPERSEGVEAAAQIAPPQAETIRGLRFATGASDFGDACPGCAEAIYLKLLRELFDGRIIICGVSGCEALRGSAHDACLTDAAVSPLEQCRRVYTERAELREHIRALRGAVGVSARAWDDETLDAKKRAAVAGIIIKRCEKLAETNEHAGFVLRHRRLMAKNSLWILCGDGISSIGREKMTELVQSGMDVNLLLFETGAAAGSRVADFCETLREAGSAYTAGIAIGADYKQTLLAMREADEYRGPSVVVAYAPCVGESIPSDKALSVMREAVRSGAWKLLRSEPGRGTVSFDRDNAHTEYSPTFHKNSEKWSAVNRRTSKHRMEEQRSDVRVKNTDEIYSSYSPAVAIREAKRCFRCRKRPCMTNGCPVHNRIPGFIEQVAKGEFEAAYQILSETSCLPAVCGRVCQQSKQCEGSCVRAGKGEPVAIGNLERFVADWHRTHTAGVPGPAPAGGSAVAVIGSGPSGIACAGELARYGFAVTVFEKESIPGGVLALGIPAFRLPKDIVRHEIDRLERDGVRFRMESELGRGLSVEKLLESGEFKAVYLANGAGVPVRMNIPGETANRVYDAGDYLRRFNSQQAFGKTDSEIPPAMSVAVIGGGNVAMDACRAAVRSGAEKVYVLYRRSEAEMPADAVELKEAREEGVEFRFLTNPVRIIADNDGVRGVECVEMELGEPDASGRRSVKPVAGTNFVLSVDSVIMALGTSFDRGAASSVPGLISDKGGISTDAAHATSLSGVFAGGDAVTGSSSVIRAMGAGREAARSIREYLAGRNSSASTASNDDISAAR